MNYTIKAEKLEMTFQIDGGFVEALLGAVRASKKPHSYRVYTPYPEDTKPAEPAPSPSPPPDSAGDVDDPGSEPDWEVDRSSTVYTKWYDFVLLWLVNFDREGGQPERGEKTRALAHSRSAGKIVKLVRELGGTTHAVYDVVEAAFKNNESARLDGLTDDERKTLARFVAENITQVSSILFTDLSDLLEYHNPLEEEED